MCCLMKKYCMTFDISYFLHIVNEMLMISGNIELVISLKYFENILIFVSRFLKLLYSHTHPHTHNIHTHIYIHKYIYIYIYIYY